MMVAYGQIRHGNLARAGRRRAAPRGYLDFLDPPSGERFKVEHGGSAGIEKETHLVDADARFDDREAVATFDGNLIRRGGVLRIETGRDERTDHPQKRNGHTSHEHAQDYR